MSMREVQRKSWEFNFNEIRHLAGMGNRFYSCPFFCNAVSAGFPNQATEEVEDTLDLNSLLVKHPAATFFIRVSGHSMVRAGIHHNDILIVDRSIPPSNGKVVIATVNGELTVKRLFMKEGKVQLVSENDSSRPIDITGDMDLHIWGVATNVIHCL